MENSIKDTLRKFIVDNYLLGAGDYRLSDSDSFLENGIIDSIGVIELTGFMQRTYNIDIKPAEIIPANFDTLDNLDSYVTKKLKK